MPANLETKNISNDMYIGELDLSDSDSRAYCSRISAEIFMSVTLKITKQDYMAKIVCMALQRNVVRHESSRFKTLEFTEHKTIH